MINELPEDWIEIEPTIDPSKFVNPRPRPQPRPARPAPKPVNLGWLTNPQSELQRFAVLFVMNAVLIMFLGLVYLIGG